MKSNIIRSLTTLILCGMCFSACRPEFSDTTITHREPDTTDISYDDPQEEITDTAEEQPAPPAHPELFSSVESEIFHPSGNSCDPQLSVSPVIQEILDIYNETESSLDTYKVNSSSDPVTVYTDENGSIRKVTVKEGTYTQLSGLSDHNIEFYYQKVDSYYELRFIFAWSKDSQHRLYYNQNGACIRYISPDSTIYDNNDALLFLNEHQDLSQVYSLGMMEIHYALAR